MSGRGGFRLLCRLLAPRRRTMLALAAWTTVEAIPAFVSGLLVARALDHGFLAGRPLAGVGWLLGYAAVYAVAAAATRQLYPRLADTVEPLRDALLTAVITACVHRAVADPNAPDGAGVAQATEQVETVRDMLATLLRNARQFVAAAIAVGGLAVLSPWLALGVTPPFLLALLGFGWFVRALTARQRAATLAGERLAHVARPIIDGVRDVVAATAEPVAAAAVGSAVEAHADAVRAFARARTARVLLLALGVQLPLFGVLAAAPWLIEHRYATVGTIGGAVVYLSQQLEPAMRFLVNAAGTWLVVLGVVLGRLAEVTGIPSTTPARAATGTQGTGAARTMPQRTGANGTGTNGRGTTNGTGTNGTGRHGLGATADGRPVAGRDLRLDSVTFAYSEHARPVVRGLSLDVPAGTHLAVVGPSGAGKSTLANLIAGIVTPQHGAIRVDGVPVADIAERDLRQRLAMIPQEAYVFTGTVRENLGYLRDVTTGELDDAVRRLGLRRTVARLGGYDAHLAAAAGALSAGERQLFACARVYLSRADVVVLDEATSNLDPAAEATVETAFAARGGTLIVIAHRISSARRAHRVLLMDGEHTLLGGHQDLLGRSPLYADLVGHWDAGSTPPLRTSPPPHHRATDARAPSNR